MGDLVIFEENGKYIDGNGASWPAQITGYNLEGKLPPEYTGERIAAPNSGINIIGVGFVDGVITQKRVEIQEFKGTPWGNKKDTAGKPVLKPVFDILANIGKSKQGQVLRFVREICDAKYLFSGVDSGKKHSFTPNVEAPAKAAKK